MEGRATNLHDTIIHHAERGSLRSYLTEHIAMPPAPFGWSVVLDLTSGCTLDCVMCPFKGAPFSTCSDEVVDAIGARVLPSAQDLAIGCHFEPLLHPRLAAHLATLDGYRRALTDGAHPYPLLCLLSSGVGLTEERSRDIARSGVDHVLFSIDSAQQAVYEQLRPPAKWPSVRDKVARFVEVTQWSKQAKVAIQAILMKSTLPYVLSSIKTFYTMGIRTFSFSQLLWAGPHTPQLQGQLLRTTDPAFGGVERLLGRMEELALKYRLELKLPRRVEAHEGDEPIPIFGSNQVWDEDLLARDHRAICVAPWHKAVVDAEGNVFPCVYITDTSLAWGSILDEPLDAILDGPAARDHRACFLEGRAPHDVCRRCPYGPGDGDPS